MSSALSASAKGATFLILVQIGSRALTFVINQVLLRFLSPELLGASSQLELYSISTLYFARESIRVALQRQADNPQVVINVSYLSIALGLPLALLFGMLYSVSSLPDVPQIGTAVKLYGIAAIIELFSEPCFVLVQQKLAYKVRASAETIATISRCVVTISLVLWAHQQSQQLGVLPFGIGQLAYAVSLFFSYYFQTSAMARVDSYTLAPVKITNTDQETYIMSYFSPTICKLVANMYVQSAVKYVLTQGDSLLVVTLTTLSEQGAYALASNYGGLIARMLFQPIEETGRNLFGKLCAIQQDTQKPTTNGLTQSLTTLELILRFYNLITLVAWSIGPTLAPTLLRLVAGSKWATTGAGDVLATYCYYIPLLALNGVTEAFVAAVATNEDLKIQSVLMTVYFVAFAFVSYLLLHVWQLGAQGLVWANCVNMLLRIFWNSYFIKSYFAQRGRSFSISSTFPSLTSIATAVAIGAVAINFHGRGYAGVSSTNEIIQNFGLAGLLGVVIVTMERNLFLQCYRIVKPQQSQGR